MNARTHTTPPGTLSASRRLEGLRNLRTGYDATAAVGFWLSLHGEDLIDEYAKLVEALEQITELTPSAQYAGAYAVHIATRALNA